MRAALAFVIACTFFPVAEARELGGLHAADQLTVSKHSLQLNGLGLRTKWMFKIYLAALYLETPVHAAEAILASDQVKRLELTMARNLTKAQVTGAFKSAAERADVDSHPELRAQIDALFAGLGELKSGEQIVITYVPGRGTSVGGRYGGDQVLPGKPLADAIFSIWIGAKAIDEKLKKALVGE